MSNVRARKAVIPAAGLGTRFLPASKAVPKELLPVVDVPALEYVVAEAAAQGLEDVLLIVARGKDAIANHFDANPALEASLEAKGSTKLLQSIQRSSNLARMHYVRQRTSNGLGDAVAHAEGFVGNESFAVLLGDDLIDDRDPLLDRMLDVQAERGGIVLGLIQVPGPDISRYGCVAVTPTDDADVVSVEQLVEKPAFADAPSDLAIIGRYVLPPEIFDAIRSTTPGAGGEIQLTDAMAALAASGTPVHGVIFTGRRYDTGDKLDYLKSVVQLAVRHPDFGAPFMAWLSEFVQHSGD
jgi:UTP--glucose-1-phosphate uridylyltransferase